jgi:hypothetical protein
MSDYTPPTLDEATNQATSSSQYTEQAGLYDTQNTQDLNTLNNEKTGIGQSYAQSRQSTINSYQDALDQINYGMRQVGISTRAGSAQRGLYNASGELSGIGQNVASNAIEPLVRQTRMAGERQATAMANLDTNERQAIATVDQAIAGLGLKSQQQKLDLKNSIVKSIMDAAQKRQDDALVQANKDRDYNLDVNKANWQQQKDLATMPGTRENQLKVRSEEQAKGRTYVDDPKKLAAIARSGRHTITVGKDIFTLSDKEEADLRKIEAQIYKTSSGNALDSGSISDVDTYVSMALDATEQGAEFDMSLVPQKLRPAFYRALQVAKTQIGEETPETATENTDILKQAGANMMEPGSKVGNFADLFSGGLEKTIKGGGKSLDPLLKLIKGIKNWGANG